MYAIFGLGNPGQKYAGTRHNIGFAVLDALAKILEPESSGDWKTWRKSRVLRGSLCGLQEDGQSSDASEQVILAKPQTFMNLSGESVAPLVAYFDIPPEKVIVIHDELDFTPGRLRLKWSGGAGGHNGLKSIFQHMGADFIRLRFGIGKPPREGIEHVLSPFGKAESAVIEASIAQSVEAIRMILALGLQNSMQVLHRKTLEA